MERLLPVLLRIQLALDEDLTLDRLADLAGLSPAYFHRKFRQLTGETPKQYCLRLRLEAAALRLLLGGRSILDTALDCGFRHHETFSRAFRRRFGVSPRAYRAGRRRSASAEADQGDRGGAGEAVASDCRLSAVRVERFGPLHTAFLRHVGPYEEVDPLLWDRLTAWAEDRGYPGDLLLGVANDPPGITPPEKLRFDAAIRVDRPFATDGEIGCRTLPASPYGVITHVGPWATLEQAYRTAVGHLSKLRRYRLLGLPAIELYRATRISAGHAIHQTDVCLPLALR